jgi:Domain of unknown function (DUF1844)
MAEEESFKVTDRRHRDAESIEDSKSRSASAPSAGSSEANPEAPRHGEPDAPDLSNLFVMFASSALIALGDAPDPMTGEQGVDLAHAREAVDTLLLLRDKTDGNRTETESRLLEDILYDLEMRFVRVAKGGSG